MVVPATDQEIVIRERCGEQSGKSQSESSFCQSALLRTSPTKLILRPTDIQYAGKSSPLDFNSLTDFAPLIATHVLLELERSVYQLTSASLLAASLFSQ